MKNKPFPYYERKMYDSLTELINIKAKENPDKPAFSYTDKAKNMIKKTFSDVKTEMEYLSAFLVSKGYVGKHIAIIGENSYGWLISFLSVISIGAVAVPISKDISSEEMQEQIKFADCDALFISDEYLDVLRHVCNIDTFIIQSMSEFIIYGQKAIENRTDNFKINFNPDDMAAIFFTSGTTGKSRGVMLSHKNMMSDVVFACRNFTLTGDSIAVLPFNHTFGLLTTIFPHYYYGYCTFINKSTKRVQQDMLLAKPTGVFMVPLFIETFYKTIINTAEKSGKLKMINNAGKISNVLLKIGVDLRRILFKSIHAAFGGNLKYLVSGGAPIDEKYIKAFRTWGINIYNGYGITECSPVVSVNRDYHWNDKSVGIVVGGCNVKIANDGEVLVNGDNVMLGYYKDETATCDAIIDGWYHTGDLGKLDNDGFLFLTGRKKNLIILSNGENVSPEEIEARILRDDTVCETIVYGECGKIVAEIFPTEEYIGDNTHFEQLINQVNDGQPKFKQVNIIRLREHEFKKNATKKIIRYKVKEEHNDDK